MATGCTLYRPLSSATIESWSGTPSRTVRTCACRGFTSCQSEAEGHLQLRCMQGRRAPGTLRNCEAIEGSFQVRSSLTTRGIAIGNESLLVSCSKSASISSLTYLKYLGDYKEGIE